MGIVNWHGLPVITGGQWPGLKYFCTLRLPSDSAAALLDAGGCAAGASLPPYDTFNLGDHVGDDPTAVQANRLRLAATLPAAPIWLDQVHGTEVFDADKNACATAASASRTETQTEAVDISEHALPVADAAVTATSHRVLCIMTADCLPVVLSDEGANLVGLAHAGWRGLAAGVLEGTLAALRRRAPAGSSWRAWIGPAIGQAAFEVGGEVREAFISQDAAAAMYFAPGRSGRWQADLAGLAARRLSQAGVGHVEISGFCTHARSELFYSYRRDGVTGRMATVAWLDSSL